MSDFCMIHWSRDEAKVRRFSATSGAKATIVKIELEVLDGFALSSIMRCLEEAQRPLKPAAESTQAKPFAAGSEPLLQLPAPLLRLSQDGRS